MTKLLTVASATLLLAACAGNKHDDYKALHTEYMDSSANPADDFYSYVNGKWMKKAVIPSDRGRWGSFDILAKQTDSMTLLVVEDALKSNKYEKATDQGKVVTLYSSVMDTVNRDKQGIAPLKPYLDEIAAIKNVDDWNKYIIKNAPLGESTLMGTYVDADAKNSNKTTLYVSPPGLGLPERDYYMKTDKSGMEKQQKYREFIAEMLMEFGTTADQAKKDAQTIYDFEKQLATAMLTKEKRRDPVLQYNPFAAADAYKKTGKLDMAGYINALGIKPDTIVISEPEYMKAMAGTVNDGNIDKIKLLAQWGTIRGAATLLSSKIEKMNFDFYGKYMRGTQAQRPRKERALGIVNGITGEALGKLYVDKYFSEDAKKAARQLVDDLIAAYRVRINNLDWMSPATKAKAQKKLDKLMIKIGYPDKWRDYGKLEVKSYADGGSYFQNMLNAGKFEIARNMAKYGKPVDKTEWGMSPQTVNAYYNPAYNEIVFPAAILQPPFFDFRNDAAINFGGIGAVIGHEISHGFDDQGAQYDEDGNLINWWTENDLKQFKARGAKLAQQFNAFEALPGKFVNGEFTMGENIGDLGGVASAYDGLQIALKRTGKTEKIDGFTQEQRFFLSWATVWRNKTRDQELELRLATDPHSPGYFRAIGPLQNHEGFYAAFNVKPGNKMYRPDSLRVKIW